MRRLIKTLSIGTLILVLSSCSSTKQLTITTVAPSPVEFSNQIRKIGIVNNSKSSFVKSYSTRLEQLIVVEEKWLAEKGTEATLTGLFDELVQGNRFDSVRIIKNLDKVVTDFGTNPNDAIWQKIALLCKENGVDAIFSLASHETETQFSLKKTKMNQLDMMRDGSSVSAQEITLETLIENGWRIYDPNQRILVDEFTSNEQISASGKGVSPVDALQAIDKRREILIAQSKSSGSSYAQRMKPSTLDIQRNYYVVGTRNFGLADEEIQSGDYIEAKKLWEAEVLNSKRRISGRACYNLAVISEFNGDLDEALQWANKSYEKYEDDSTVEYIASLKRRLEEHDALQDQLVGTSFDN